MAASDQKSQVVAQEICQLVDSQVGGDLNSLETVTQLLEKAAEDKNRLEDELSVANSAIPRRVHSALADAETVLQRVSDVVGGRDKLVSDLNRHLTKAEYTVDKVAEMTAQVKQLEKHAQYLQWIMAVDDLSNEIQSSLLVNSTPFVLFNSSEVQASLEAGSAPAAVTHFGQLVELGQAAGPSSCRHLLDYINTTTLFWYNMLAEKLSREFGDVLKALRWPFIATTQTLAPSSNSQSSQDAMQKMDSLFVLLLKLQLPDNLVAEVVQDEDLKMPGFPPILLPLQQLLQPLKKRFRYHFYGNKQTNSRDKPEWFFTQVLNWIRDHGEFLESSIQPILDREGFKHTDARMEFVRGLLALVTAKLSHDIPEWLYDEGLLSHAIDETLLFDQELKANCGYVPGQLNCLNTFTQPACFERWLAVEKKYATEKVDALLSAETAWTSQYKDVGVGGDVSSLRVPECADSFVTLLQVITDRYASLAVPERRLQFLDLQLELVDDFRVRLLQVVREESRTPLAPTFSAILNTINYLTQVLQEWGDQVFFVQLQYYQKNPGSTEGAAADLLTLDEDKLEGLEGTVFDDMVELYQRLQGEHLNNLAFTVFTDVKAASQPYQREKWFSLPAPKDFIVMGLSPAACDMFQVLKDHLYTLSTQLAHSLFALLWLKVAELLNRFLYEEVILGNQFNGGGASQLQYDMTRNLFPLFAEYTQKPESYFREVKEACTLLNLKLGSAILLRDLLYQCLHDRPVAMDTGQSLSSAQDALGEVGVYHLTLKAAEIVLNLRTDWPKS